jgi:N-dimethylarginine dimethylaminohydrolase
MHLMGTLRLIDRDLALTWPGQTPAAAVAALEARGYTLLPLPDPGEAERGMALNLVTLAPRRVLMPAGNPITEARLRRAGVDCRAVAVDELVKAAGGIGCMTGVLHRRW